MFQLQITEDDDWPCYSATFHYDEQQSVSIGFLTRFVGFADDELRIEIRKPSPTTYLRLVRHFENSSVDIKVVRDVTTLLHFWESGGLAAIDVQIAEQYMSDYLKPEPCASTGFGPFNVIKQDELKAATQRAPSKKKRMKILERDNYRCRICGQSPSNNVNIELHVHHIRPWADRGVTVDRNLVTLCQTCHGGLDPHWNLKLARFIEDEENHLKQYRSLSTPD